MALSPEDAQRLADLEAARDARLKGRDVQTVSSSGRSVSYAKETLATLNAEIEKLKAAETTGTAAATRGAISFRW